jgi:hypothetical protein
MTRIKLTGYGGSFDEEFPVYICPRRRMDYASGEGLEFCSASHAEANDIVQDARNGIKIEGALTTNRGKTVATNLLNDLELMHPITEEKAEANKKYLEFLKNKYGTGRELWVAFEEDAEKEMRQSVGADGPDDIANDMNNVLRICSRIAETHQEKNPDKRVIVFAIGFYDNLSPWIKKYLLKADPAKKFVPIEKGSGLVIKKTPAGVASTIIGEKSFSVEI